MKRLLCILVTLALSACASAHAYPIAAVAYGAPNGGPTLQSQTVNFGAATLAGHGAVGLASVDVTKYAATIYGLDIWNGNTAHTPVSWTIQDVTSTGGYTPGAHFAVDASTTCGGGTVVTLASANPPTPRPCAAGVTAGLNKGPYVFQLTATDALGHVSSTVTLTYTIVANAVSVGDQASDYNVGANKLQPAVPSSWTSTGAPSGAQIILSTGANWVSDYFVAQKTRAFLSMDFSHGAQVTFTYADATKPGGLWELELGPAKNVEINGVTFTGPAGSPNNVVLYVYKGSDSILVQDVSVLKTANDVSESDGTSALSIGQATSGGATNVTVNNFTAKYMPYCIYMAGNYALPTQHISINNTHCRYSYDNFLTIGNSEDVTFNDTYLIGANRKDDLHVDCFQVSNAATPMDFHINRLMCIQADGTAGSQGPLFGGRAGVATGYIDNGSGGAGTILHVSSVVSGNGISLNASSASGAVITSTADGLGQSVVAGTQMTSTGCGSAGTTCSVSVSQLVGSAASPVTIYTAPWANFTINGLIYTGASTHGIVTIGESGTSTIQNFTYVKDNGYLNGQGFAQAQFTGMFETYAGVAMLTAGAPTSFPHFYFDSQIFYGGGCNPTVTYGYSATCTAQQRLGPASAPFRALPGGWTGAAAGTGGAGAYNTGTPTLTASLQSMYGGLDWAQSTGPTGQVQYSDAAQMHLGSTTWSSGFVWGDIEYLTTARTNGTQPSSVTIAGSVIQGGLGGARDYNAMHTYATTVFAGAQDPQYTLSLIAPSHWASMTDAQIISEYVGYLTPLAGGDLNPGSGSTFYGALTGAGLWNDGSGKTPG